METADNRDAFGRKAALQKCPLNADVHYKLNKSWTSVQLAGMVVQMTISRVNWDAKVERSAQPLLECKSSIYIGGWLLFVL